MIRCSTTSGLSGVALALLAALGSAPAAGQDRTALYGTCFAQRYDPAYLARDRGQRVSAIAVQFQGFEDSLLASVTYALRYGTKFGFSGECRTPIEGGFLCEACGSDVCEGTGETFKVLWSGGDSLTIVNDSTGFFARNAAGGRDRVAPGGAHAAFELKRVAAEDCAW